MSLPAPFGRYELLERIGRGGMADVFLARAFGAAGFEKRLVIKRIRVEHARDPRFVSMFIHEAKVGVHLNHPNLVTVYELGKVGETWYIAMEYVHGHDLNRILRSLRAQERRLPVPVAVRIVAEVLRGLAYAHGLPEVGEAGVGLVHRDVSPHNVLVTFTGDVKLVDFGIARLLQHDTIAEDEDDPPSHDSGPSAGDDITDARPAGGKFAYMSPEQARGEPLDARSDLYSAGAVLWELLVGDRMFRGTDPEDKLRRVQQADVPDPARRGVDLDDTLRRVLDRALTRYPADRYDSAQAFEEDLRAWLYEHRTQPGRQAIAAEMSRLFPQDVADPRAGDDLRRLAEDLRRLDGGTGTDDSGGQPASDNAARAAAAPEVSARASDDERKRVVAMVVDVDGFTGISEAAEPEVLFQRHLAMLRWLRGVCDRHGGTIQHVHDDQGYVLFGLPRTRRDDLDRALACAAELQRRVTDLGRQGVPVALAIGLHTGDVTVGRVGGRIRYAARGDTTRLARRLSEQADHGQVLVSDAIQRAMEESWGFQRGPWLLGRGQRAPLPTWVLGDRRPLAAGGSAWLRRADELSVLQDAMGDLGAGRGATVIVRGEGGTGKSRLVREIATLAGRRGVPVLAGRATAFGTPTAPLRELLLAALGLDADADDDTIVVASERLRPLGLAARDLDTALALLGVRRGRADLADIVHALRRILVALAESSSVVVVVEDLQLLPARTRAAIGGLAERLSDAPILLLLTTQGPAGDPSCPHAREVLLGPFPPALQARLAADRLGVDTVDAALAQRIVDTCEGNPLYIEELVRFLRERGRIAIHHGEAALVGDDDDALPGSLAALLAARIDALDPASKGALQLAASLGMTFPLDLLGDAIGLDDATPIVDDLAAHGLVRRSSARGMWSFASAFVMEAALRGTLGVQRRDHHRLIAAALERRLGDDPEPAWLARLARHCGEGGRPLDATRYAYAAGKEAEASHQPEVARHHYRDGLRWLQQVEETQETWEARTQGEAMMRLRLGMLDLSLGDARSGLGLLRIALDVAEDGGLPWVSARAHLALGRHHLAAGEDRMASAHLDQAWQRALHEDDPDLELDVTAARAAHALARGETDVADTLWETTTARLDPDDRGRRARALTGHARVAMQQADAATASRRLEAALIDARGAADRVLEARVLEQIGRVALWDGRPDEAVQRFRAALAVREDIGHGRGVARGLRHLGDVHLLRGDLTRAWVHFRRSRDIAAEAGWRHGLNLADAYLGFIDGARGRDDGVARIEGVIRDARALDDVDTALTATWLLGRLLAERGEHDAAHTVLGEALDEARRRHLDPIARTLREALETLPSPAPRLRGP